MGSGCLFFLVVFSFTFLVTFSPAEAGWWFGEESQWEKSGLNLESGYDRNTVITQRGRIMEIDSEGSSGPALAVLQGASETMTLVLGAKDFWRNNSSSLKSGDEISVRGSKAVGRDGKAYLIVQKIELSETGTEIILRNETGRPAWSGTNRPERQRQIPMHQLRGGRQGR